MMRYSSLPDPRQVTVTNDSVVVDGRDVSDMVTAVDIRVTHDAFPVLQFQVVPDVVLYSGSAMVPGVPLDGIARLRKRLGR